MPLLNLVKKLLDLSHSFSWYWIVLDGVDRATNLTFAISTRCQNNFTYQSVVFVSILYKAINISARSTPPILLLYIRTMLGTVDVLPFFGWFDPFHSVFEFLDACWILYYVPEGWASSHLSIFFRIALDICFLSSTFPIIFVLLTSLYFNNPGRLDRNLRRSF